MHRYFPEPFEDIRKSLEAGDRVLNAAMSETPRVLRRGTALARAGEPQASIYRLRSGLVARTQNLPDGRRQILMVRVPGELMSVRTVLLGEQLDNIEAISAATVQELSAETARALARSDSNVALRFMWQLAEDDRRLHNWVMALGRGSAIERIATLMLDLRGRLMHAGFVSRDKFALSLTQQQIANHLGLTPIHVNRTLRRLREEGSLSFHRGVVEICDVEALARYAAPLQGSYERRDTAFGGGPGAWLAKAPSPANPDC